MNPPNAEEQIKFLTNLQRLLSEGAFVSTYKYALLLSLADLALEKGNDSGGSLTLSTSDLSRKFVQYYWRQTFPYRENIVLKQNTGTPAEIIEMVQNAVQQYEGDLPLAMKDSRILRHVEKTVKRMPLWKLQTVGKEKLEFLYPNVPGANQVDLLPGVAFCLRKFYTLIGDLVRGAWVRYIRRFNQDIFGPRNDLHEFLFGSERSNLKRVEAALIEVQGNECFYCDRTVDGGENNVDHFIPWSRYPVDLGHNFVLAHAKCNGAKSDSLASHRHLEKWLEHLTTNRMELDQAFGAKNLICDWSTSIRIANWAYAQTHAAGGLTWINRKDYEHLPPTWTSVFNAVLGSN